MNQDHVHRLQFANEMLESFTNIFFPGKNLLTSKVLNSNTVSLEELKENIRDELHIISRNIREAVIENFP